MKLEKIALSMIEGMNAPAVRALVESGVSLKEFFEMDKTALAERLGNSYAIDNMKRQEAIFRAKKELEFVERHNIKVFFLCDDDYPLLLRDIPDAPVVLYALGNAELNSPHTFNVVGTRRCTSYGIGFTRQFVTDMHAYFPDAILFSGLAYGIDAAGHMAALECGMRTVAVVAHGLDMIYPAAHRDLAKRIIAAGGAIVSEYPSTIKPLQRNFLQRNRIIAGLSELTVVAESEVRGGAMSTANQAFSYSRDVVALPGRYSDVTSSGCNNLIARHKATIFTSVADIVTMMNWKIPSLGVSIGSNVKSLFPELEGDAAAVYSYLHSKASTASIDELHVATRLAIPALMAVLTELEFDGIITKLPGSRYELA